ncbi:MAG: hypothetical protein QW303_01105 [Nitrososphaerota archaeon]
MEYLYEIIKNPFYLSIIITLFLLFLNFIFFYELIEESTFWKNLIKMGIYIFATTSGLLFFHYQYIENSFLKEYKGKIQERVISEITKIPENPPLAPET